MNKLTLILVLCLALPVFALAQSDPLSPSYRPTIDTNCAHSQYASNIWMTDGMTKLFQTVGSPQTNACYITTYGTQNEFSDFQIHFHDTGSGTAGLKITVSNFVQSSPSSYTIGTSATDIIVYREAYMHVTTPSATACCAANPTPVANVTWLGAGYIPDILIPAVDPYYHQTTNAWPFTVVASNNQSAWVDVHIPPSAPAGYYLGSVTVESGCPSTCTTLSTMPVILGVWQWPSAGRMPSTATLHSIQTTGYGDFCVQTYGASNCGSYPGAGGNVTLGDELAIVDQAVLLLDHRLSSGEPIYPTPTTSFNNMVQYYGPLYNGTTANTTTILPGAKLTTANNPYAPSTMTYTQSFATAFNSNGWSPLFFNYGIDEPGTNSSDWTSIIATAATLHAATPPVPQLITTNIANATTYSALNAVDWMTPIINDMDPPPNTNYGCCSGTYQRTNYNTWLAGNSAGITRRLWSYLDCESAACGDGNSNSYNVNWPNWEVDGTPTANRAMEWLTFYHQQTGELYFGTTICWNVYCPGDTWTNVKYGGVWGDGTLVYPGRAASNTVYPENVGTTYAIWLPSLRLKLIRDGYQDFEYLNVLTNLGHGTYVQTQITSWITNSTTFNNNGTALQTARTNLGNALHQLTYPPVLLPPPSLNGTLQ